VFHKDHDQTPEIDCIIAALKKTPFLRNHLLLMEALIVISTTKDAIEAQAQDHYPTVSPSEGM